MKTVVQYVVAGTATLALAGTGFAADVFVYPQKDQSAEQQNKDSYECYNWAKAQSGIDPGAPPPPAQPGQRARGAVGGAARGAALGAAVGAIAGDAGRGAAAGGPSSAVSTGVVGRWPRSRRSSRRRAAPTTAPSPPAWKAGDTRSDERRGIGVFRRNRKEGTMHRIMLGVVAFAWMGIVSSPGVAAAKEKPAATLKLSGKSVAAGVGISWGKGTLNYKGKQHPFSIDGLSVADVGVSSIDATGNVYHLKKLEDFEGQYTAASAGAAVAGGAGVSTMKNANGVVINLHAMTRGVKFKLGVDGVKIKLEE